MLFCRGGYGGTHWSVPGSYRNNPGSSEQLLARCIQRTTTIGQYCRFVSRRSACRFRWAGAGLSGSVGDDGFAASSQERITFYDVPSGNLHGQADKWNRHADLLSYKRLWGFHFAPKISWRGGCSPITLNCSCDSERDLHLPGETIRTLPSAQGIARHSQFATVIWAVR